MSDAIYTDPHVFDGGPPLRLQRSLGLVKPEQPRPIRRALLTAGVAWIPLALVTVLQTLRSAVPVVAYLSVIPMTLYLSSDFIPLWQQTPAGSFSVAGWWHLLVSLPLLLILLFGWFWRMILWARFLVAHGITRSSAKGKEEGAGELIYAAKVKLDGKKVEIENYGVEPARLQGVRKF